MSTKIDLVRVEFVGGPLDGDMAVMRYTDAMRAEFRVPADDIKEPREVASMTRDHQAKAYIYRQKPNPLVRYSIIRVPPEVWLEVQKDRNERNQLGSTLEHPVTVVYVGLQNA